MALITKAIKGTKDVLPKDVHKNQYIEATALDIASKFGYKEIRTPVFEHTELFQRGVGDTTDVVQKEMYTFDDKGGRSITLRPEGTAGAVRSFLENGLCNEALPQKVCYLTSCYRYEKPQAGRLREFHQFGVECFGTASPLADAEIIALAKSIFDTLGVRDLSLEINSIGCPKCRAEYHKALKEYFASRKDELCDTCKGRLDRNPMRILDCKSPICHEIAQGAPVVIDLNSILLISGSGTSVPAFSSSSEQPNITIAHNRSAIFFILVYLIRNPPANLLLAGLLTLFSILILLVLRVSSSLSSSFGG